MALEVARGAAGRFLVVVEQWRSAAILWGRRLRMKLQGPVGDDDDDSGGT